MGQEPNYEIAPADRPRPTPEPAPARRWRPNRPGDLHAPSQVPWGGAFGTPGPDTGYALKLASEAVIEIEAGESRENVESLLVLIMSARASLFGKAPSFNDLRFGLLLLGAHPADQGPPAAPARLAEHRQHWAPRVANDRAAARRLASLLSPPLLRLSVAELQDRLARGEAPLAP